MAAAAPPLDSAPPPDSAPTPIIEVTPLVLKKVRAAIGVGPFW